MNYETALQYANEVKDLLSPHCHRCEIAGGIRRKKQQPHDIELVCIPKFITMKAYEGLFEVDKDEDQLHSRIARLIEDGILQKGDPDKAGKKAPAGPKYYRLKYKSEKLDVFAVIPPAQWGTIFLIRTGDADFSREFVTRLWWHNLRAVDGHIVRMHHAPLEGAFETIDTPEEADCFRLCQMHYIEPEKRTIEAFKNLK